MHVPSTKEFQTLSVETINPGAGYMVEVVQNIRALSLCSHDYCLDGGTVNQKLTKVRAARGAEVGDELRNAWNRKAILSGEFH